jgi:hypothetical protein
MLRIAIASLIAATFVVATTFANPADASTKRKHQVKHEVEVVRDHGVVRDRGAPPPGRYYGVPANYYPAPPFPFFLFPGPWWLPAHG